MTALDVAYKIKKGIHIFDNSIFKIFQKYIQYHEISFIVCLV